MQQVQLHDAIIRNIESNLKGQLITDLFSINVDIYTLNITLLIND
jgi:hypothetical protein